MSDESERINVLCDQLVEKMDAVATRHTIAQFEKDCRFREAIFSGRPIRWIAKDEN